ncbi:MAG TPA: hypothetical protein ENH51_02185 [Euryarchaeota archaeon]|nr:hypothetical protein [Euryarchaeota archaeon]
MSDATMEKVYEELKALRGTVEAMKEEIEARFMTPEEDLLVEKALKEHRRGETISVDELKKELGR